jgi:hypothetical protein
MGSEGKVITIFLICLTIFGIVALTFNHIHTEHYIAEGYQNCYIMGHGTEWMKECNPQFFLEKR